ncbi:related to homeoprotein [Rhynchosporium secalis]|uniref:Related to homeoprotein n=1 Tax=Rhynchosporium secalis TaxID=38038 RepID=A0A1E1MAX5_RHYSE|nr:related to homeoprotein [Rhynchosporium secalis]
MLATRPFDSGRNTWSSSKLEALYQNVASPRMSNFDPLPAQPDWREQFTAFSLPGDNSPLQPSFDQSSTSNLTNSNPNQLSGSERPALEHRHSLGLSTQNTHPSPTIDRPDSAPGDRSHPEDNQTRNDSLVSTESAALSLGSLGSNPLSSASSAPLQQGALSNNDMANEEGDVKDEDDELDDDDDMLDIELEEGAPPQTAAERRAERRKMKRFRLTHQQTRFLMSEFAKQAHPDAAHRERLSREIPGLSPRQVQVWFQNRRAKIKRLTADDRERMMKMRAVPDDFDNVQALHSPYGAVHGVGTPMQSPVDFVPGYGDHMMRPLMVDTMRRNENDDQMSPTGLSPAYGNVAFAGASMGSPDILSPLSLNSQDRYYSSHLSSPMSTGPRSSNPFDRQNSYQELSHSRQHVRPLQPLQLRETMSRARSDSLQSPLRSSMSWKGETLDYSSYQTGQPSPQSNGRQQSVYQPEQMSNNAVSAQQYDGNSYSASNVQTSPTHMTYPPSSHGGRLRASSAAAFPAGLDLRAQYRAMPNQNHSPLGLTPRSSSFAHAFSGGYASAPLAAPVDFSLPRTPINGTHASRDYNIPQLSAPMAPPQDFSSAYSSSLSPSRSQQNGREFSQGQSNGDLGNQGQANEQQQQQQQGRSNGDTSYLRSGEYETGQKRKRSFDIPSTFESP